MSGSGQNKDRAACQQASYTSQPEGAVNKPNVG